MPQEYPTATNPQTGEKVIYVNGRWESMSKYQTATNPQTQEKRAYVSGSWVPMPSAVTPKATPVQSEPTKELSPKDQTMPKTPSMADMAIRSRMMGISGAGLKEAPKTFGDYLHPLTTEDWWKTTGSNFLKEGWEFVKSQPEFMKSISPTGWADTLAKRLAFAKKPTTKEEALAPIKEAAAPFTSVTGMVKELVGTAKSVIEDPLKAINEKPFKVALLATTLFGPKATAKMRAKLRGKVGITAADLEEAFTASGGKLSELANAPNPVQKIISAIKEAKPVRAEQEVGYTIERGKRFARAKKVGQQIPGEKGFFPRNRNSPGNCRRLSGRLYAISLPSPRLMSYSR